MFPRFSMDFLSFSQKATLLKIPFLQADPWKFLIPYRKALALQIDPWKGVAPCNWALGHRPPVLWANSGEPAAESGRARAGNGLRVPEARFPGSDGSGPQPARWLGSAAVGRPLVHVLRRRGRRGRGASDTGSCGGHSRWWWCAHTDGCGSEQEAHRGGVHGTRWRSMARARKGGVIYRHASVCGSKPSRRSKSRVNVAVRRPDLGMCAQ
jgi:hypothetical protein